MKTRDRLMCQVVVTLSLMIGGSRHVAAQGMAPQQGPNQHHIEYRYQSQTSHDYTTGKKWVHVLRGDVKMGWNDGGLVPLTIGPDEITVDDAVESTLFRVPMDRASLRVNVTSTGTVFEDKKGHKLTVVTSVPPDLSVTSITPSVPAKPAASTRSPQGGFNLPLSGLKGF